MNHSEIIEQFYTSFSNGNAEEMIACYHKDIVFRDPVFGTLQGEEAVKMWEMLLSKRTDSTKISFSNVKTSNDTGTANWRAEYIYGEKKRKIINIISAHFKFKDGKIIEHVDSFDLWKWSGQALGPIGVLLGWTPFIKNKIQKTVKRRLSKFIINNSN
tara:strand:+ start:2381 stop:2854 length:474 start_codon:yes stop_codon:yes gene_type:complete